MDDLGVPLFQETNSLVLSWLQPRSGFRSQWGWIFQVFQAHFFQGLCLVWLHWGRRLREAKPGVDTCRGSAWNLFANWANRPLLRSGIVNKARVGRAGQKSQPLLWMSEQKAGRWNQQHLLQSDSALGQVGSCDIHASSSAAGASATSSSSSSCSSSWTLAYRLGYPRRHCKVGIPKRLELAHLVMASWLIRPRLSWRSMKSDEMPSWSRRLTLSMLDAAGGWR